MLLALAMLQRSGDPIRFLVGFLVMICIFAIIIIAGRWLIGLTGLVIPQPLQVILGIALFLILLLWLLNYTGVYVW